MNFVEQELQNISEGQSDEINKLKKKIECLEEIIQTLCPHKRRKEVYRINNDIHEECLLCGKSGFDLEPKEDGR